MHTDILTEINATATATAKVAEQTNDVYCVDPPPYRNLLPALPPLPFQICLCRQ